MDLLHRTMQLDCFDEMLNECMSAMYAVARHCGSPSMPSCGNSTTFACSGSRSLGAGSRRRIAHNERSKTNSIRCLWTNISRKCGGIPRWCARRKSEICAALQLADLAIYPPCCSCTCTLSVALYHCWVAVCHRVGNRDNLKAFGGNSRLRLKKLNSEYV